jgi:hypothetical protein
MRRRSGILAHLPEIGQAISTRWEETFLAEGAEEDAEITKKTWSESRPHVSSALST